MKALSLRQPWAHAVIYYGKTLENRVWNTTFRGEFLIHAAKGMKRDEYDDARDFIQDTLKLSASEIAAFDVDFGERGKRGGVVGIAHLVDVIRPCVDHEPSLFASGCSHPWHMPEQFAFVLEGVRALPFVPWKGELGFFNVPEGYANAPSP